MCNVVQNFTKWFMILAQNFLLKWNNSSLDTNIHVSLRLCYLKWLTAGWILFLGCLQLQAASWVHNFCDLLSVCLSVVLKHGPLPVVRALSCDYSVFSQLIQSQYSAVVAVGYCDWFRCPTCAREEIIWLRI